MWWSEKTINLCYTDSPWHYFPLFPIIYSTDESDWKEPNNMHILTACRGGRFTKKLHTY